MPFRKKQAEPVVVDFLEEEDDSLTTDDLLNEVNARIDASRDDVLTSTLLRAQAALEELVQYEAFLAHHQEA